MSYEAIRRTISDLAARVPQPISLTLDDGTKVEHPGGPLEFFADAQDQINRKRGPLCQAALHNVSATGCGRLHDILFAMAIGPVITGDKSESERSKRNAGHSSRKRKRSRSE